MSLPADEPAFAGTPHLLAFAALREVAAWFTTGGTFQLLRTELGSALHTREDGM